METKAVQMISSMVRLCEIQDPASAVHSLQCNPIHPLLLHTFTKQTLCLARDWKCCTFTQLDVTPGILSMTLCIRGGQSDTFRP